MSSADIWGPPALVMNGQGTYVVSEAAKQTLRDPSGEFTDVLTAVKLLALDFPEPQWIVPGILPEGVTLLASKPKMGKTFWALNVAHAVACGGCAFGKTQVDSGRVLYLDLEGTRKNLQQRLKRMLGDEPPPNNLHFPLRETWTEKGDDAFDKMERWMRVYPDTRLIVVDTLKKIRSYGGGRSKTAYDVDYEAVEQFGQIAETRSVNFLLIHHNNKMADPDDPYDAISGSTGLRGAVTTEAVLNKDPETGLFRLRARGRDLEEVDYLFEFDPTHSTWLLVGDTVRAQLNTERKLIYDVIREADPERLRPKAIHEVLVSQGYKKSESNVRHLLRKMAKEHDSGIVGNGRDGYGINPLTSIRPPNG